MNRPLFPAHSAAILGKAAVILSLLCGFRAQSQACTLFGVAGGAAAGTGPIVVKNRDREDTGVQKLKVFRESGGFPYFALVVEGGRTPGVKAGINNKGLTVISATASSIPKKKRARLPYDPRLIARLLAGCSTADEAAASPLLTSPGFLVAADSSSIIQIEIPPAGKPSIRKVSDGALVHTNHYLDLPAHNLLSKPDDGSHVRLARAAEMLAAPGRPLRQADLKKISFDRHDGPDRSIFRTGSAPGKPLTLAVWTTDYSDPSNPEVRVWLKDGKEFGKKLDSIFDD